mmetsp:Transcript_6924/g.15286  ORF Transcript_6924/g.15286 Transcript_6924/m.15286 type:complete len:101 (-) Transcript_6924:530-832(-)
MITCNNMNVNDLGQTSCYTHGCRHLHRLKLVHSIESFALSFHYEETLSSPSDSSSLMLGAEVTSEISSIADVFGDTSRTLSIIDSDGCELSPLPSSLKLD